MADGLVVPYGYGVRNGLAALGAANTEDLALARELDATK